MRLILTTFFTVVLACNSYSYANEESSAIDINKYIKVRTNTYEYTTTFPVLNNGKDILFKFYVKTEKNAHIILSPTVEPSKRSERAYEILLGTWRNFNCTIIRDFRGGGGDDDQIAIRDSSALSPNEWRFFWIQVSPNGYFQIGNKLDSRPFLVWQDNKFTPIKHIGLANYGSPVDWAIEWINQSVNEVTKDQKTLA